MHSPWVDGAVEIASSQKQNTQLLNQKSRRTTQPLRKPKPLRGGCAVARGRGTMRSRLTFHVMSQHARSCRDRTVVRPVCVRAGSEVAPTRNGSEFRSVETTKVETDETVFAPLLLVIGWAGGRVSGVCRPFIYTSTRSYFPVQCHKTFTLFNHSLFATCALRAPLYTVLQIARRARAGSLLWPFLRPTRM